MCQRRRERALNDCFSASRKDSSGRRQWCFSSCSRVIPRAGRLFRRADPQAQGIAVVFRPEGVDPYDLHRAVEVRSTQIGTRAGRVRHKSPHIFRSSKNRRGGDNLAAEHAPKKILVEVLIIHRVDHAKHGLPLGASGWQRAKDNAAPVGPPLPFTEKNPAQLPQREVPNRILDVTMMARPSQAPREGEAVCTDGTVAREGQSTGTPSASTSRKTPATFTTASGHKGLVEKEGG